MKLPNWIVTLCGAFAVILLSAAVALTSDAWLGPPDANAEARWRDGAARHQSPASVGGYVPQAGQSLSGVVPAQAHLYLLDDDNGLWFRAGCGGRLFKLGRVRGVDGLLIGIDYRPANGLLYGLSERGQFYVIYGLYASPVIDQQGNNAPAVPFTGGLQSLMDFNPVLDAVRLIASDDQNYAVVNNFAANARQTDITYAAGDVNAGRNPSLVGGAYTNSYRITPQRPTPAVTLFFGLDYSTDTLIYIAPAAPGGSSATGGGRLQTIGALLALNGARRLDITPLADCDIYSDAGGNHLVGVTGRVLFALDLDTLTLPPLGQSQNVAVRSAILPTGGFIDIAVSLWPAGCGS